MFFHLSCACRTLQVPWSAWFPKQFRRKGIPLCSICLPLVLHLPAISVLWLHWDRRISFVLTGLPLHLSTTSLLVCSEIAAKQFPLPPTCLCAVLGTEEFTCLPLVAHLFHISPNFCLCFLLAFQMPSLCLILLFLHLSPMANGFHDRQQSALDISSFCLGSGIISFSFFWDPFWVCLKTKKTAAWFFMFFQHSWNFWKAFSSSSAIRPGQINSVSTLSWQILWSQWCWAHRDVERWPFQALRHCHARYNAKVC